MDSFDVFLQGVAEFFKTQPELTTIILITAMVCWTVIQIAPRLKMLHRQVPIVENDEVDNEVVEEIKLGLDESPFFMLTDDGELIPLLTITSVDDYGDSLKVENSDSTFTLEDEDIGKFKTKILGLSSLRLRRTVKS